MSFSKKQKERFEILCPSAGLDKSSRQFWFSRLESAPEEVAENALAFFELFPQEVGWLTSLQERKEAALANKDQNAWQEILNEEKEHIETLLKT